MEYKIEVIMTPYFYDSPKKPYFWLIGSYCGKDWCTHTAGWATTPEEAWKEAYDFYNQYLNNKED